MALGGGLGPVRGTVKGDCRLLNIYADLPDFGGRSQSDAQHLHSSKESRKSRAGSQNFQILDDAQAAIEMAEQSFVAAWKAERDGV